jgi:hypothetical protein
MDKVFPTLTLSCFSYPSFNLLFCSFPFLSFFSVVKKTIVLVHDIYISDLFKGGKNCWRNSLTLSVSVWLTILPQCWIYAGKNLFMSEVRKWHFNVILLDVDRIYLKVGQILKWFHTVIKFALNHRIYLSNIFNCSQDVNHVVACIHNFYIDNFQYSMLW